MISKTSFGNGTIDIIIILQSGEIEIFLLRKQFLQLCKKLETRIHIYIYIYIYIAWLAGKCKTKLQPSCLWFPCLIILSLTYFVSCKKENLLLIQTAALYSRRYCSSCIAALLIILLFSFGVE